MNFINNFKVKQWITASSISCSLIRTNKTGYSQKDSDPNLEHRSASNCSHNRANKEPEPSNVTENYPVSLAVKAGIAGA